MKLSLSKTANQKDLQRYLSSLQKAEEETTSVSESSNSDDILASLAREFSEENKNQDKKSFIKPKNEENIEKKSNKLSTVKKTNDEGNQIKSKSVLDKFVEFEQKYVHRASNAFSSESSISDNFGKNNEDDNVAKIVSDLEEKLSLSELKNASKRSSIKSNEEVVCSPKNLEKGHLSLFSVQEHMLASNSEVSEVPSLIISPVEENENISKGRRLSVLDKVQDAGLLSMQNNERTVNEDEPSTVASSGNEDKKDNYSDDSEDTLKASSEESKQSIGFDNSRSRNQSLSNNKETFRQISKDCNMSNDDNESSISRESDEFISNSSEKERNVKKKEKLPKERETRRKEEMITDRERQHKTKRSKSFNRDQDKSHKKESNGEDDYMETEKNVKKGKLSRERQKEKEKKSRRHKKTRSTSTDLSSSSSQESNIIMFCPCTGQICTRHLGKLRNHRKYCHHCFLCKNRISDDQRIDSRRIRDDYFYHGRNTSTRQAWSSTVDYGSSIRSVLSMQLEWTRILVESQQRLHDLFVRSIDDVFRGNCGIEQDLIASLKVIHARGNNQVVDIEEETKESNEPKDNYENDEDSEIIENVLESYDKSGNREKEDYEDDGNEDDNDYASDFEPEE